MGQIREYERDQEKRKAGSGGVPGKSLEGRKEGPVLAPLRGRAVVS